MQLRSAVPAAVPVVAPAPAHAVQRPPQIRTSAFLAAVVAAVLGATAAVFASGAPARAAGPPTISVRPSIAVGWSVVEITGTATPGTTVQLWEGAWQFWHRAGGHDNPYNGALYPAEQWTQEGVNAPTSDVADGDGNYSINRTVDSGFAFFVEDDDGRRSAVVELPTRLVPVVHSMTPDGAGSVRVVADASPGEKYVPVEIQRRDGGSWVTVGSGNTTDGGRFEGAATGQPGGRHTYRLYMAGQPENNLLPGYSETDWSVDAGSTAPGVRVGAGDRPTTAPTTRPTTAPTTRPTTAPTTSPTGGPTTSPTTSPSTSPSMSPSTSPTKPATSPTTPVTPAPVKPAPAQPGVGSVQFSRIHYDAPGKDSKTTKSLNGEWARLTNRTDRTINLRGWSVRDLGGHVYAFAGNAYLAAGRSVTIHTGPGTDGSPSLHRYWSANSHVWNNGGDTATLRSDTGLTIDTCRWTANRTSTGC